MSITPLSPRRWRRSRFKHGSGLDGKSAPPGSLPGGNQHAVPDADFVRSFGLSELPVQQEAVPVLSNGTLAGYFIGSRDYEELLKLKGEPAANGAPIGVKLVGASLIT